MTEHHETHRRPPRAARRSLTCVIAVVSLLTLAVPQASAAKHTFTLRQGPISLGAFQTKYPRSVVPALKRSGYIVGMRTRLVDRRGRPVSIKQVMLHHVVFINHGYRGGPRKLNSCDGRGAEPFYGTGEETQRLILPPGYGYKVNRRDRWTAVAMYMSHTSRAQQVYLQYTITVETSRKLQPVTPLWLRANGCDPDSSYTVTGGGAPGSEDVQSHDWKMPISGRIVAAGAHMHGSAKSVQISQPRCGSRTLIDHRPLWGNANDPVYKVRPSLHEPGPIATGYFLSRTGIPIRKGEYLRVTGRYDGQLPHPQVMAITHIYVARDRGAAAADCVPLPADQRTHWTRTAGRLVVPPAQVPLTRLDARGRPVEIARAEGPETVAGLSATVAVRSLFEPANLSIARGGRVTWVFRDRNVHIVQLANGPRAVESALSRRGTRYTQDFPVPGTYNLFCYLHPVTMHQTLTVRP